MARGRMLSKSLSTSEKFAALASHAGRLTEFTQLLFTMLVPHSDDFGRLAGDAFTVKHSILPCSPRSIGDFTEALCHLQTVGLIDWYRVNSKLFIQIRQFDAHQQGLHKRTASHIPEPSGKFPEIPGNSGSREEKRTEEKRTEKNRY